MWGLIPSSWILKSNNVSFSAYTIVAPQARPQFLSLFNGINITEDSYTLWSKFHFHYLLEN